MHSLHKGERLKSAALMDLAFKKGVKIKAFPVLVRATAAPLTQEVPFQAAFTVGKKRFRRAVDRNRIKRLLREALVPSSVTGLVPAASMATPSSPGAGAPGQTRSR